eukprot:COSAG03_NODE_22388_length_291_cov_1.343750_1_plen_41_part_10
MPPEVDCFDPVLEYDVPCVRGAQNSLGLYGGMAGECTRVVA